ncbi:hypothetical protein QBC32DRAFT_152291 [Pseudoneurospora amorphoporcata]|uniref:Uncharacterized protein n=1 Tax=Pseudoneurospora amorphoporcata TaxID=241081 RepID=A0AAN6SF50_9PEZI|nr:hypothetical protein QBC32DRAFT_152291 [Pseudoneurospora amorphoporcata]
MPPQALKPPGFWCILCGKKFTRKEHLERHIPHHTGHKPWGCDHCLMSFGRQDLLRRHQAIYHSIPDGVDPLPSRVGSHRPDVACKNCHTAKCLCDKQKPVCGACQKKGIECVPRQNLRVVKAQNRARRSAAPQQPAPPAQLPLLALSAPFERDHPEPVMEGSLEEMLNAEDYQQERCASEAAGSQNSFMSGLALTENLAPGGPFAMNGFDFTNPTYEGFDNFDNVIQPFSPKDANLGSESHTFPTMIDLSRTPSFGTGFEGFGGITDLSGFTDGTGILSNYAGFADYNGFATNDKTHHSLPGNQKTFKHFGQNDGSVSVQHRSQMSQSLLPNAVRQQVYSHFEPTEDRIISLSPTSHQDFALTSSYGLPSPAKTTPSPPPSGSCAQFGGDETAVTNAESQAPLYERWKHQLRDVPFEVLESFVSAKKELSKKRGAL